MNSVPTLFHIDFCDYYKIRMTTMDGTKMYLVSDLLRQYNEKHGTNKRFGKYLDNKQTKDLLRKWGDRLQKGQNGKWNIPRVIQYITTSQPLISMVLIRVTSSARNFSMLASCGPILLLPPMFSRSSRKRMKH